MEDKVTKAEWRLAGVCTDCGGKLTTFQTYYHSKLMPESKPFCRDCSSESLGFFPMSPPAIQSQGRGLRGGLKYGETAVFMAGVINYNVNS